MRSPNQPTRRSTWGARLLPGGIRARLFLLIALALLPLLLLLGWVYYQRYETRRDSALETELEVAQGVATTFKAFVDGIRRQNYVVGQSIVTFSPYTESKAVNVLAAAADQYASIRNMSWVGTDGTVLASTLPAFVGGSISTRPYFRQILAGRPWAIGNLTPRGIVTPTPTFAIATAIRDESGVLRGVVVAGIEPARLDELILTRRRPGGGAYAIFDSQGVLVYRNPETPFAWQDRVRWRQTDSILRHVLETGRAEVGIQRLDIPGGRWVSARAPMPDTGWVAGAGRPVEVAFAPVWQGLITDALLAVLITSLAFLLAYLLARTIAGPLRNLERDAEAMGAGEIEPHSDPLSPTEVRHLRDTVTAMASDLISRAEALRESEEQLRQRAEEVEIVMDTAPVAIWIGHDPQTHDITGNRMANRFYEAEPGENVSANVAPVRRFFRNGMELAPDELPMQEAAAKNIDIRNVELDVLLPSGKWLAMLGSASPLRDPEGHVRGSVGVFMDITERRRAEEALIESEKRFRQLADAMPQLVWTAEPDGRVDYYNRRYADYRGISPSGDEGYQWAPVLHEDDVGPTVEAWQHSLRTGEVYQIEHRVQLADGTYRWHLSRGIPARDENGNITKWYGTATDIDELKRSEEKLRELAETLEQRVRERTALLEAANKELEAFAYSVSHDLRAPLRTIDGFSLALLEDYEDKLDQEGRDYLHFVRDAAQRMAQLIDDILRLSRIGRAEMHLEDTDLSTIAESVIAELRQQAPDRQVNVNIRPGLTACGDPELLRVVLENLLGNAWKYTSKTPDACIEFASVEQDGERVYYIMDNGAGFDMAYADRLFAPFQRLHTEGEFPGTGIGLSIVRRIISRHGGRVWAEGAVGKGATFYFTLPTEGECT